jgi:hypothetical protein
MASGPSTSKLTDGRNPGSRPPPTPCEEKCEAYVFKNCVLRTSSNDVSLDKQCDVAAGQLKRLFETFRDYHDQINSHEQMVGMLSVEDQIKFHERMVALPSEIAIRHCGVEGHPASTFSICLLYSMGFSPVHRKVE